MHNEIVRAHARGVAYHNSIDLYNTVKNNENFYIGRQWENVDSCGLPTPVFNFIKRVVAYVVATVASDGIKINTNDEEITRELSRVFEKNHLNAKIKELTRDAAVCGDGCFYVYYDNGLMVETVDNTRIFFGDTSTPDVQRQPYIIISKRELVDSLYSRTKNRDAVLDEGDGKQTVLIKLYRKNGRIYATECTKRGVIRPEWCLNLTLYPIVWFNWEKVRGSYHGQAMVSGLMPNQIFINKLYAMAMISLMTTAYPKILYDKTRIDRWDNRVGSAIGVVGGDMEGVAKVMSPATISPQLMTFIDSAISYTREFMGASSTALGAVEPTNTSAIVALQKASAVPLELNRVNLYRAIEDLGRILIDFMKNVVKSRVVDGKILSFSSVSEDIVLDVGTTHVWSEAASVQTLDRLLERDRITLSEYLERLPEGYITNKAGLLHKGDTRPAGE